MIIGITGYYSSGKDTLAQYLQKKGFEHCSLSDEIRVEAQRRNLKLTRENLIELGNYLREKFGSSILAERVRSRLQGNKDYVITSFRNPAEVQAFLSHPHFTLVSVIAKARKRFELLQRRAREEDPTTFKEFVEKEKLEQSSDPTKQQLHQCQRLAKIIINNDGTLKELYAKTDQLLLELHKKHYHRPSWDEYFLGIVDAVAKRATCDRGRTAVILVKDKRILATGYVGSPMGLAHCDEVGHQMKKVVHEAGKVSQHCVRTNHAEINAISLAARNGISIEGATLYCKLEPCYTCAKMIINAGIRRVVCQKQYHAAEDTRRIFLQAKIQFDVLHQKVEEYPLQ